jgi:phosphate transport system protein
MAKHLQRDLDQLAKDLLTMGALVEDITNRAINALVRRNRALAHEVAEGDRMIDDRENQIEESALKIIALHQPVATDLRFIITALKVNNDLERIGDHAVSIAERAEMLADLPSIPLPDDFSHLVEIVQRMVHDSLNALVERNAQLARSVCMSDDEVDRIHRLMYSAMQTVMKERPDYIESAINTISATRHMERIADLATNIAEDVVFMVEGEILRHHY